MATGAVRFEVLLNGKRVAIIGVGDFGVLSAIVNRVRRSPDSVSERHRQDAGFDEAHYLEESCRLSLTSLDSVSKSHATWEGHALSPGDEVTIRVLQGGEYDMPRPVPPIG